ncbi:hypothetical protein ADH65_14090 [[Clostridium] innocuum]|nr:hypothetical protein ADH65_14090 [[Clostridium] innocuum]
MGGKSCHFGKVYGVCCKKHAPFFSLLRLIFPGNSDFFSNYIRIESIIVQIVSKDVKRFGFDFESYACYFINRNIRF